MRAISLVALFVMCAAAQQALFVPVTGPDALKSSGYLFQDSRGGLWIGGCEGVEGVRYFDGTRFINPVIGDFPHALVNGMEEDSQGGIWLATSNGLFRLIHGRVVGIIPQTTVTGITKVAPDVFITTVGSTLVRIARSNGAWRTDSISQTAPAAQYSLDHSGDVLFLCPHGFCEFQAAAVAKWVSGGSLVIISHKASIPAKAKSVLRDRSGCVWTRSIAQVSYQCPGDSTPIGLASNIAGGANPALSELSDGSMVLPSFDKIAIGRPGHFRVLKVINGYPSVAYHIQGRDGSIWLSNANGLFVFNPSLQAEFWTERDGLDGNTWSTLHLRGKEFVISGNTVNVLQEDRMRWKPFAVVSGAGHLNTSDGRTILVSSETEGVVQIGFDGKVIRRSAPTNVARMASGADGKLWAAGDAISQAVLRGNNVTLLPEKVPGLPRGTGEMVFDRSFGLWSCSLAGLAHLAESQWKLFPYPNSAYPTDCYSITVDHSGHLWYGFHDLYVVNSPRTISSIERIPSSGELEKAVFCCSFLGTDSEGRLWRGNPNGVFVADPAQARRGQWLQLNRADGLPGNDTNQGSFRPDTDGSVWFGIDSSVIHMFPSADLVHPTYAPSVFVSGFSSGAGPFQMAELVDSVPSNSSLTAHFGSLQIDRRNSLNFRYRLLPAQNSWKNGTAADIDIGKPDWGEHRLEVQARLLDGPWSAIASKSFRVLRPIWLSTPALLGFVFVGGLAAAGSRNWYRRRKQRDAFPLPGLAEWRLAAVSPDVDSLKGALLDDRFEVIRIVARGGFANIWEGRERNHGNRLCAVKIFRHELVDKSWMDKRFQHEVSALSQIHHPNVVQIYGHGKTSSGAPYLVMEFVRGQTLREVLRRGKLTHAQTAGYLRQTARALAEIHAHGICHRDLKPENLMIRGNGDLVLIDFSIAIVQDPDETIHGLSRAAGTIHYMAPEQAIGYANESTDIYSLAKILIEMLAGERLSTLLPDASIDLPEQVRELLSGLNAGLSPSSIDLVATALEFDPSRRPKSAHAFGHQISQDLEANSAGPD